LGVGIGGFVERPDGAQDDARAGIDQIDPGEIPAGVAQMHHGQMVVAGRDLEAPAFEAHGAVRAAQPARRFDAEGVGEQRRVGAVAPHVGAGEIAFERRGVEFAVPRAVILLFDPGLGRLVELLERKGRLALDHRHQAPLDADIPLIRHSFPGDAEAPDTYPFGHTLTEALRSHQIEVSAMFTATPTTHQHNIASPAAEESDAHDVIETRLWLEEHDWLYRLLRSEDNVSPTFRFPDLISASVSLVFTHPDAAASIFRFLGTELVLRPPETPRRRESMWRHQYQLLLDLQRSPANRHPNPKFQLDQLTTACVALCRAADGSGAGILRQARRNMAERSHRGRDVPPG
jgi:hypothetical protein